MTPTDGRHEVAPRLEAPGYAHPLLGARDIERDLAGAQQPAVDVTHWDDADDLAGRDRCHRLVDELHALRHTPGGYECLTTQGERVIFEIDVAEPPPDGERCRGQPFTFGRVVGKRGTVEGQPAVPRTFARTSEQGLGPRHPAARCRHVAVDRAVQERQPARAVRALHQLVQLPVCRERALGQLDRRGVLAQEVQGPAQAIQGLGILAKLESLLERGARAVPVGLRQRLPTAAHEVMTGLCSHRTNHHTSRNGFSGRPLLLVEPDPFGQPQSNQHWRNTCSIGCPKPRSIPSESAATSSANRMCARSVSLAPPCPMYLKTIRRAPPWAKGSRNVCLAPPARCLAGWRLGYWSSSARRRAARAAPSVSTSR